jgi:4-hydroxy-tetrahydrodipicolinate synthase
MFRQRIGQMRRTSRRNLLQRDKQASLKGIFNITVTPFATDGSIDFPALARSIERVVGLGYDGLLIGGTYGEFPTMSPQERAELFRRSIKYGASKVPVMLCTAASDPRVTLELTQLASELGGYAMVTAPYVSEVQEHHILEYFRWIAPAARNGLIIYNAPGIGITLSASLIEELSEIDNVVGLKQGDLDPTVIDLIANRLSGKLKLFCASDLAFLGPIMAGFDGLSSTNSCAFPELILATYRAVRSGDTSSTVDLHRSWFAFRELARRYGQPQTVKAAMAHRGWGNGLVRSPLLPLTSAQLNEVAEATDVILAGGRAPLCRAV